MTNNIENLSLVVKFNLQSIQRLVYQNLSEKASNFL